ncbi:hypothetical protein AB7X41_002234 [Salmonella enterica]|nr:hypothetical protein [Salmonella enterica]EGN6366043.1 hypothetical protein [Salmonella enterica]
MKHVKNVFLVLAFALSTAAFSTFAMAASDTKAPEKSDKIDYQSPPDMSEYCKKLLEEGGSLPPGMYQYCWEH